MYTRDKRCCTIDISWRLSITDKKHWMSFGHALPRRASDINLCNSAELSLLQNGNDILQFAVNAFKIRHDIFVFSKSLVLLPGVSVDI